MSIDVIRHGSVFVLQPEGILNAESLEEFATELANQTENGQPRLLLDLSRVPLLDSVALELLIDQQLNCTNRGGVMKLCGVSPLCHEILTVTGLCGRFEVFDNQMTALGSFAV
jgi:anti-anti-sigma factor